MKDEIKFIVNKKDFSLALKKAGFKTQSEFASHIGIAPPTLSRGLSRNKGISRSTAIRIELGLKDKGVNFKINNYV